MPRSSCAGRRRSFIDKEFHSLPAFSGEEPILIGGATLLPQSLWVIGGTAVMVFLMWFFFERMTLGKAMLAMSYNRLAARLVGINVRLVLLLSFVLAALLGAIGGILVAPLSVTYYEVGIMLGLKGFCAAILGRIGPRLGCRCRAAWFVGVAEAMGAGYVSSDYKDVIAFVIILLVLFFRPSGLLGKPGDGAGMRGWLRYPRAFGRPAGPGNRSLA